MTTIHIESLSYCGAEAVAMTVAQELGYRVLRDQAVFAEASKRFGVPVDALHRAVYGPDPALQLRKGPRPLCIAQIRVALSRLLQSDSLVCLGLTGCLIPASVSHVLRVSIVASRAYRTAEATREGLSVAAAMRRLEHDDQARADWLDMVASRPLRREDAFDIVIPIHESPVGTARALVCEHATHPAVAATPQSRAALSDFQLLADLQLALTAKGHLADVSVDNGNAEILVREHSLFLNRLQAELETIAVGVAGIKKATVRVGPRYPAPSIGFRFEQDLPARVLLVDDEREFVLTLSERLRTREIDAAVAFDGREALAQVQREEPEVMVLDLNMPGVDGLEVLRQVKQTRPDVQVVILTGHGSEAEQRLADELGAFAYLRKPVDIEALTETMQAAYRKAAEAKAARSGASP